MISFLFQLKSVFFRQGYSSAVFAIQVLQYQARMEIQKVKLTANESELGWSLLSAQIMKCSVN